MRVIPNPPAVQDLHETSNHIKYQGGIISDPNSFGSLALGGHWEGFGRPLKTLDPEEDWSLRPDFAGKGPFARLGDPSESCPTSPRHVKPKKSSLGKPFSGGGSKTGTASTTIQSALNLSDDFSSPKSRPSKLAAEHMFGLSELIGLTAEASKLKDFLEKYMHINQQVIQSETGDDPAGRLAYDTLPERSDGEVSEPKNNNVPTFGQQEDQEPNRKTLGKQLQEPISRPQDSCLPLCLEQRNIINDKPSSSGVSFWPEEMKRPLAVAARKALLSNPRNRGKTPFETTIQSILDETSDCEGFCRLLEKRGFRVERGAFERQLLATVPKMLNSACFGQSDFTSSNANEKSITPNSHVKDIAGRPDTMQCPMQCVQALPHTELGSVPALENGDGSTPRLAAPAANMHFPPFPTPDTVKGQPGISARPDETHSANGRTAFDRPRNMYGEPTGVSIEAVQSTPSQMETLTCKQTEDNFLKGKARKIQEKSKYTGFETPSVSLEKDNDNTNGSLDGPKRSPSPAESSLFLPDFEPTNIALVRPGSGQKGVQFAEWSGCNGEPKPVVRKRRHADLTILDYWDPEKKADIAAKVRTKTTLKDGHFAHHEERKKAMSGYAKRTKSYHQEAFDGQYVDLDAAAGEYDRAANSHPTTGCKGISDATRRRWESETAAQPYQTPTESEIDGDESREPEPFYQYRVQVREWLIDESEDDARVAEHGPFYTKAEANAVAADSVQKSSSDNTKRIFSPGAWSYNYSKGDEGMEMHTANSCGGSIEASVSRSIKAPDHRAILPFHAFTIPRVVYLAMSQHVPVLAPNEVDLFGDPHNQPPIAPTFTLASTLKACTTLDLANKTAGQKWLELEAKDLADDDLGKLRRARVETSLRKDLRQMNDENVSFDRTSQVGENVHIWVDMVEIDGPRN